MADNTHTGGGLPVWRIALWGGIAALLITPLVAMQFTAEVNWTGTDFLFAGLLLTWGAALFELVMAKARTLPTRAALGLAILAAVGLVWIEAAVGIFH